MISRCLIVFLCILVSSLSAEIVEHPFPEQLEWSGQWIGLDVERDAEYAPPVYLAKTFKVEGAIKEAIFYVSGLGIFDPYLNGERITESWFSPGWTDYNKRVYYRAFDLSDSVQQGDNVLGAILADGWYSGHIGWTKFKRNHYGTKPRFNGVLVLEMTDGTQQVVSTDDTWQGRTGPQAYASFLRGERYDARLDSTAWSVEENAGSAWRSVDTGSEMTPLIQPHPSPRIITFAELPALSVDMREAGHHIFDFGQNFAGVVRLNLANTKAGQEIKIRYAERLKDDGEMYVENLRSAEATDYYICKGGASESWTPRFTFHGFQYVEVSGVTEAPDLGLVTGLAISNDTRKVYAFESDHPLLNQLVSNIYWTQRANFISIPTDCPQRDERLGWTGDAQAFVGTAAYICDVRQFFNKWLTDLRDSQFENGQIPMVAPAKVVNRPGGPGWSDAMTIVPWELYERYGDRSILEDNYEAMRKYVDFLVTQSRPGLLPPEKFHSFGDWLNHKADTPRDVIYQSYFAYSASLVARSAEVLQRPEDVVKYTQLAEAVRASFVEAHVDSEGKIYGKNNKGKRAGDTQTCYVMAIAFDLLQGEALAQAKLHLVRKLEERDGLLSTGFLGTRDLLHALSLSGRDDLAYGLLLEQRYPSWLFPVTHGATSIWERWDGWTPERGFQAISMNSFSHYAYGAVYEWMVQRVGGIYPTASGFTEYTIAPVLPPDIRDENAMLKQVSFSFDSPVGLIRSEWKQIDGDTVDFVVEAPAAGQGVFRVDVPTAARIEIDGEPAAIVDDVYTQPLVAGVNRFRLVYD
ncbi:MAG: family 78 glycoside hydrolase catalytic domain [Lentimonas sp.]